MVRFEQYGVLPGDGTFHNQEVVRWTAFQLAQQVLELRRAELSDKLAEDITPAQIKLKNWLESDEVENG